MSNTVVRYSDADLEEFRQLILKKMERAQEQLELLQNQIYEVTENGDGDYGQDMMDDSNTNTDVEMLNSLAIHQRKYLRELENALSRIRHKTYGICEVTGELIDKKRLLAVPTTTKSLAAKLGVTPPAPQPAVAREEEDEEETEKEKRSTRSQERQVITKVIRKTPPKKVPELQLEDEEEEFFFDEEEEDDNKELPFQDMDEFSEDQGIF